MQFKPSENKRFVETPTISASHRGAALEGVLPVSVLAFPRTWIGRYRCRPPDLFCVACVVLLSPSSCPLPRPRRCLPQRWRLWRVCVCGLAVVLSGEGVSPSLAMVPADGLIDMGHVIAGDTATATVTLKNTSVFPLTFSVVASGRTCSNHNGTLVFGVSPLLGNITPGGEAKVTVTFAPDHASRAEYFSSFRFVVPNQTFENVLTVKARSWARQVCFVSVVAGRWKPSYHSRSLYA